MYERILEMDKRLDQARKQLQVCEDKERKLQKEMVKGPKEVGLTQDKLQQAVDTKSLAETECECTSLPQFCMLQLLCVYLHVPANQLLYVHVCT